MFFILYCGDVLFVTGVIIIKHSLYDTKIIVFELDKNIQRLRCCVTFIIP
jgi:hypothetical protein